jgi:dGTPase
MAYDAHDVDDALQLGLLSMHELMELGIVRRAMDLVREKHGSDHFRRERQLLVHELIDLQVTDFLYEATEQLVEYQGHSRNDLCNAGVRLEHSGALRRERGELEAFLFESVYRHPRLIPVRRAAYHRLQDMFEVLVSDPGRLPLRFRRRLETRPLEMVVGEYLAGMTDGFCDQQYKYATDGSTGPLADW